jgi:hypothetical protein
MKKKGLRKLQAFQNRKQFPFIILCGDVYMFAFYCSAFDAFSSVFQYKYKVFINILTKIIT